MKNLIYLVLTVLIVACSGDDISVNNVDYFFEIELAGTTYRIEGNTEEEDPGAPGSTSLNLCYTLGISSTYLQISDKSASEYVSGENIRVIITLDNASLGSNTGTINPFSYGSTFFTNYLESIGGTFSLGFIENGPLTLAEASGLQNKISNINITDLGSAADTYGDFGETLKGTYEGVLWFPNTTTFNFDIPVPIKIEFNSVRIG
jgi:hypothetical protein